jgi:hypothetical protein
VLPVVVSLAWGDKYQAAADRLEKSAKAAGLVSMVTRQPGDPAPRGVDAWAKKPTLLETAMSTFGLPVLWVDVDFEVCKAPTLLTELQADVIAYTNGFKKGVFEDGVVWFNTTPKAKATLAAWRRLCEAPDLEWSHHALSAAIAEVNPAVRLLPPEYHWVERWRMPEQYGRRDPVIREVPCTA